MKVLLSFVALISLAIISHTYLNNDISTEFEQRSISVEGSSNVSPSRRTSSSEDNSQVSAINTSPRFQAQNSISNTREPKPVHVEQVYLEYGNFIDELGLDESMKDQIFMELALNNEELESMSGDLIDFSRAEVNQKELNRFYEVAPSLTPARIMERYLDEEQYRRFLSYSIENQGGESDILQNFKEQVSNVVNSQ